MIIEVTTRQYKARIHVKGGFVSKASEKLSWARGKEISMVRKYLQHTKMLKNWRVVDTSPSKCYT